jgi:hypothetical protein
VQGTQVGTTLPEIGIGANRYTLILVGSVQKLRLLSWDALPRIDKTVNYHWKPGVWYRLKLTTEIADGKGVIKGKAWPRDEKEPAAWTVEVTDSYPITEGSATLYGYVTGNFEDKPGTEIYYDNLRITPNKAGGKAAVQRVVDELLVAPAQPQDRLEFGPDCPRPLFPLARRSRR